MIRALVVDDEDLARANLIRILRTEDDLEVAGEARNGVEALQAIEDLKPDAVFLDIEMPGVSGLEVAGNMSSDALVIFTTAYDEYAVRAFEANALDYLLKPIRPERLRTAIERIRSALSFGRAGQRDAIRQLLRTLKPERRPISKLAVRRGKRIMLVAVREILHISIEDKLVFVHTDKDRFLADKSIGELEEMLADCGFPRISRGNLVNLEHVREQIPWMSGTYRLRLSTGVELSVSRERTRELKNQMGL